jgi:hypothetical protein
MRMQLRSAVGKSKTCSSEPPSNTQLKRWSSSGPDRAVEVVHDRRPLVVRGVHRLDGGRAQALQHGLTPARAGEHGLGLAGREPEAGAGEVAGLEEELLAADGQGPREVDACSAGGDEEADARRVDPH